MWINRFYAVKDKGINKTLSEEDLEDVTNGLSTSNLENREGWFVSLGANRGEKVTGVPSGTVLSAVKGRLVAYTGINGGIYDTPVKKRSTIIPLWWRQVF